MAHEKHYHQPVRCGPLAALLLGVFACQRSPRDGERAPERAVAEPAGAVVTDAGVADAAIADAAALLTPEQRALADGVLADVRELAPGRFRIPAALHRRYMLDHLDHADAMGDAALAPLANGKIGLLVRVGPSPILSHLGLRDGDLIVKLGGRLVNGMRHTEEAFLRVLLLLDDGALDVELDRGTPPVRVILRYEVR